MYYKEQELRLIITFNNFNYPYYSKPKIICERKPLKGELKYERLFQRMKTITEEAGLGHFKVDQVVKTLKFKS